MTQEELIEALTIAGNKHGGHVTRGSIIEQLKVIDSLLNSLHAVQAPPIMGPL